LLDIHSSLNVLLKENAMSISVDENSVDRQLEFWHIWPPHSTSFPNFYQVPLYFSIIFYLHLHSSYLYF
jgi:hypothetical protein